jgi:hypothetical protein
MKRRHVFGSIAGAGTAVIAGSRATTAQDDDLVQRVADLEEQMAAVLERLDALEGDSEPGESNPDASGEQVSVSGSGKMVSDDFELAEGRYKVEATCTLEAGGIGLDNFIVHIFGPRQEDYLFNELIEADWEGSVVFEADDSGAHYVEVETGGDWSLTFVPR